MTDEQLRLNRLASTKPIKGSLARGTIIGAGKPVRHFGPEIPYRNAQGILVCPPRYAKGFKPNQSTFKE